MVIASRYCVPQFGSCHLSAFGNVLIYFQRHRRLSIPAASGS
jgi:hypothetical protein